MVTTRLITAPRFFLFDGEGYLKGTISYGEAHDTALAKLKRLIGVEQH